MSTVFCNQCGHRNPSGSRFCSSCGSALEQGDGQGDNTSTFMVPAVDIPPDVPEDEEELVVEVPAGTGMLVVRRGPNAGSTYALDADMVRAGRHPESEIFLDDVTVSRRHAEFTRTGGGYQVADVGSLNGTYVNKVRIDDAALLEAGDEVQIGKFRLVYLVGPDGA